MNKVRIIIILILSSIGPYCWSQTCVQNIVATTNAQQYSVNQNGTVSDRKHNIMWTRCSLGQQWSGAKCSGNAIELSWTEAMHRAESATIAGFTDWRLPDIHELSKITELQCLQPAINLMLFPTTTSIDYWTATEFINNPDFAWRVHFGYGENHSDKKIIPAAVRLVRSISDKDKQ